jgi:predicted HNH restriction endonuclease
MDAMKCEYCGKEKGYFEVHHVGKLKNVLNGKRLWQRIMITRQRKTMVLCVECHHLLHSGKLPDWKAAKSVGSGEPDEGKLSRPVRRGDDG